MVKVKNKTRSNADTISTKKAALHKKTLNPFEVHINKEKLKVLGRKLKNDRGAPGISRAKALSKRKRTLLPEYELQHKANKFHDKRIGEKDKMLTTEDKNMARYTAVRVRQHNKKSIFNLADDEILTHRGQTLSEIEKFDDPRSDEEDIEETGRLDAKFVEDVHFGGGMLKKAEGKSHKDLIEQLIIESKKRKAEMQKQKAATTELTEKLDSDWKDLLPLVSKKQKTDEDEVAKKSLDDYDKMTRELKFEARGTPSDKLKTEDEIAREDKEKLEKLERERLERMRGVIEQPREIKHKSADDLDDNFAYEDNDFEDVTLSYNEEGRSNVQIDLKMNKETNEESEPQEEAAEDEEEDDSEGETDDGLSDLKESEEESESDEENDNGQENPPVLQLTKKKTTQNAPKQKTTGILKNPIIKPEEIQEMKTPDEIKEDLLRRKEVMEKARSELPYTYSLPDTYETLQTTLHLQSPEHQGIIIERMIKCNHPSLKEGNKDSLSMLFVYLLQYLNDLCADIEDEQSLKKSFRIFANLTPYLFDLAQLNPENAASSLLEVIKEKQHDFRGNKTFPGSNVDVLIFLKLISCLFSTSDYKHHVVNPTMMFIDQMLTRSRVKTRRDVAYGIFLVCLVLEYSVLSKRFLPSAITFLNGILHMAVPKTTVRILKISPPFKSQSTLLVLTEKPLLEYSSESKMDITHLLHMQTTNEDISNEFKHLTLNVTVSLLKRFYLQLQTQPSCYELFERSVKYMELLPFGCINDSLKAEINNFIKTIDEFKNNRQLEYLQMDKQKPKALRLYEPSIQRIYDVKSHKVQSKDKAERDKLIYKLKKEQKGAMREIRRDKAFLGRVKVNKRLRSDAERREKVKRIYSEAAMQQSELNAMDRSNNRKKKT